MGSKSEYDISILLKLSQIENLNCNIGDFDTEIVYLEAEADECCVPQAKSQFENVLSLRPVDSLPYIKEKVKGYHSLILTNRDGDIPAIN